MTAADRTPSTRTALGAAGHEHVESADAEASLGEALLAANRKAQKRQRWLLGILSTIGGIFVCAGLFLSAYFFYSTTALFYIGGALCAFGVYTMLLMVQPTFRRTVRVVCLFGAFVCAFAFLLSLTTVSRACGGFKAAQNATEGLQASCVSGKVVNIGDATLCTLPCIELPTTIGSAEVPTSICG